MKPTKILSILLTITLLGSAILVIRPVFAAYVPGSPVYFTVEPVAIDCSDVNASAYGLETPGSSSPIGRHFNVNLYLNNATLTNVPNGITSIAVQLNFTNILSFAQPVNYTDDLCTPSGVFNNIPLSKLLFVNDGLFDDSLVQIGGSGPGDYTGATQVVIGCAEKLPLVPWNGTRGLIATVEFNITSQPGLGFGNATGTLDWKTGGTGATTVPSTQYINFDIINGTVQIDAASTVPPQPNVYFDSPAYIGTVPLGSLFNITVMISARQWWCVSGFDVNVTWDNSLINLVADSTGTALPLLNSNAWTGSFTSAPGWVDGYFSATGPASGGSSTIVGSLMELEFNVTYFGTVNPPLTCPIAFEYVDLVSWTPVPYSIPPWSGSSAPVDLIGYFTVGADSTYMAPVVISGPNIDIYDQYPAPYGGQGIGKHSDAFAPQQNVTLYANVTQGGYRVINKLVVFQIFNANATKITILQNTTDNNGIAIVIFRIPQTANLTDPNVFGWWHVVATVEIDQEIVSDTMWFQVGWLVWVDSITANNSPYPIEGYMNFTMVVGTISEQNRTVLLSADAYDHSWYPIGEIAWTLTVHAVRNMTYDGPGSTITVYYTFGPVTDPTYGAQYYGWDSTGVPGYFEVVTYSNTNLMMEVPNWARIGQGLVAGYALTGWPANGGTAYAPAAYDTFATVHP